MTQAAIERMAKAIYEAKHPGASFDDTANQKHWLKVAKAAYGIIEPEMVAIERNADYWADQWHKALNAMQLAREAILSCKYTKVSWHRGSRETYSFDYPKVVAAENALEQALNNADGAEA